MDACRKDDEFAARLRAIVGEEGLHEAAPLSAHTTFKVGGPAPWLVEPATVDQIRELVTLIRTEGHPLWILGLGSNVLVSDQGIDGVVIKLGERFSKIDVQGDRIRAQAGASNEAVADAALAAGLGGYEFACGIPGSIGGAAIMNAGAYEGEFKDVAVSVLCLDPEQDALITVTAAEAEWSYRHSMMMDRGYLVLEVTLELTPADPSAIKAKMDDLQKRRSDKQPLEMASAGSTFKRPEGYFAGKLIQDAGLRGHRVGGAQVSEKHCGFVVNTGEATAADLTALIAQVQDRVKATAGVELELEVRLWGFEDGLRS